MAEWGPAVDFHAKFRRFADERQQRLRLVEGAQGKIDHPFEHRQQAALDLVPPGLLFAVLERPMWCAT